MTHLIYALIVAVLLPSILSCAHVGHRPVSARTAIIAALYLTALVGPIATIGNYLILILCAVGLLAVNVLVISRSQSNPYRERTAMLGLNLLVPILVVGSPGFANGFNDLTHRIWQFLAGNNAVVETLDRSDVHSLLVVLLGLIIVTIEVNNPIALILKNTDLMPKDGNDPTSMTDPLEPARGKAIGFLERVIVFLFTLSGNLNALGIVLLAKGVARFQQLDKREFAEYVLIGTLLSITFALLVAFVARQFI